MAAPYTANIPAPATPMVDPNTGVVSLAWWSWLSAIFLRTGGSIGVTPTVPSTTLPLMDATPAVVGTEGKYAHGDHVHPTDTSRASTAGLASEVTRATGAETTISTGLASEVTRATGAETTISTGLASEITRATGAETTIRTGLASEVTRATGAETTIRTGLASEITRATGAETTISTGLASEVTRATGAETTIRTGLNAIIVRATDYGVVADNITDNSVTLQAWLNALVASGGCGWLPVGKIKFSTPLTINQSALTSWLAGTRVSILGTGNGSTILIYSGTGTALTFTGSSTGSGIEGLFSFEKFFFAGPSISGSTVAIAVNTCAHFSMKDVTITNFGTGLLLVDAFSAYFLGCAFTFNGHGILAHYTSFSDPNAISFYSCEVGNNLNAGVTLANPTTVNFIGGAIEGNGLAGAATNRYGVLIDNSSGGSEQGVVGVSFIGVYFEANAQIADIWLLEGGIAGPSGVLVEGCTFNRALAGAGQYVTNNVRLDLAGTNANRAKLTLLSNGFAGFNGYPVNAGRPYVIVNAGGATLYEVVDLGNIYNEPIETPAFQGPHKTQAAMASAWVTFDGTTGVIIHSFNVRTVVRNSAGNYTLTFQNPLAYGNYSMVGSVNSAGFVIASNLAVLTPVIVTWNTASTPTDFTYVAVTIMGGGGVA